VAVTLTPGLDSIVHGTGMGYAFAGYIS